MSTGRKRDGFRNGKTFLPLEKLIPTPDSLVKKVLTNGLTPLSKMLFDIFFRFKHGSDYDEGKSFEDYIKDTSSHEYGTFMQFCKNVSAGENLDCYTKLLQLPDYDYNTFVRGLHAIVDDEGVFDDLNFSTAQNTALKKLDALYWNCANVAPRSLESVAALNEVPKEIVTVINNCAEVMFDHMAETIHRFGIKTDRKFSEKEAVEGVLHTNPNDLDVAMTRRRRKDARGAFITHLQDENISHYDSCYRTLKKMISLKWNYSSCVYFFNRVWLTYFPQKYRIPTKKNPNKTEEMSNPKWIHFPEETKKEMKMIIGKYFVTPKKGGILKLVPFEEVAIRSKKVSRRRSASPLTAGSTTEKKKKSKEKTNRRSSKAMPSTSITKKKTKKVVDI